MSMEPLRNHNLFIDQLPMRILGVQIVSKPAANQFYNPCVELAFGPTKPSGHFSLPNAEPSNGLLSPLLDHYRLDCDNIL